MNNEETMKLGNGCVWFEDRHYIVIDYRVIYDGKTWGRRRSIDIENLRYDRDGPLSSLRRGFYIGGYGLKEPEHMTHEYSSQRKIFDSFIDDHGQEIIDKAVELGLLKQ